MFGMERYTHVLAIMAVRRFLSQRNVKSAIVKNADTRKMKRYSE